MGKDVITDMCEVKVKSRDEREVTKRKSGLGLGFLTLCGCLLKTP